MSKLFADRVSRGAAFLDQKAPGWDKKVNLDRLDIGEDQSCVIGQVFGSFNDWFQPLKDSFVRKHGFDCKHRNERNFNKLTRAWRAEIERRITA